MITEVTHENGKRVDVHRPSAINPADYELAAPLPGNGLAWWARGPYIDAGSVSRECDHCGHALRYFVRHIYKPTGKVVIFGEDCADLIGLVDDRASLEFEKLRRRAAEERRQEREKLEREEKLALFKVQQPVIDAFLEDIDENTEKFAFIVDMKRALNMWGYLTERQIESTLKCIKAREDFIARKIEEDANRVEPEFELLEGRRVIEGTVQSHKWTEDTGYGRQHKMVVVEADGNKVYGSVPRDISDYLYHNDENENRELRGLKVKLTATVERSKNDENFGYYKRPSKASVVK